MITESDNFSGLEESYFIVEFAWTLFRYRTASLCTTQLMHHLIWYQWHSHLIFINYSRLLVLTGFNSAFVYSSLTLYFRLIMLNLNTLWPDNDGIVLVKRNLTIIFVHYLFWNLPNVFTVHRIWPDKSIKHGMSKKETREIHCLVCLFYLVIGILFQSTTSEESGA